MKDSKTKGSQKPSSTKAKVLEQLIAQTRIIRKSSDLDQVEEATEWEKRLRERLDKLERELVAA